LWIITGWQCTSQYAILKDFKRCCVFNAVDGTNDDMLWNGSEEVGDVRSESEKDKGTVCEYGETVALTGEGR
jgi:hypothetical protein